MSNIYITFIRLLLEHACDLWDGCFEYDSEKIEKIQLEAARIVTGLTKFASLEALYFETGCETLAERRRQRKLTKKNYKMHNKSCPQYLSECLHPVASDISGYECVVVVRQLFSPTVR